MSEQIVSGRPPLKQYSSDVIVKTPAGDSAMDDTNDAVRVNVVAGGAGDGAILDGVSSAIKASVLDYTNSNPVAVRLTNTDGDYVAAGAGTQYADGAVRGTATGTLALGDDGTNIQSIKVDSAGELQVDVITSALPTGASTSAKQDTLLTELQLKADLTETQPVSLASVPSHAVTNAGTFAVQNNAATPAGTNAIGKLLPPDVDVTTHTNYIRKYYTSAGAATDGIVWSPAAGKRWHIIALHFQVSAAAIVTFEDDKAAGDDPVLKGEYAANGGEFLVFPENYPMASGEDAADFLVTTSAGNIYITCVGYEI